MSLYTPGQQINEVFHEYASTTGLVEADFTIRLYKNGATSVIAVTITEIANGDYHVAFTPDSSADWSLDIVRSSDDGARYGGSFPVRAALAVPTANQIASAVWDTLVSAHLIVGSFGAYLNRIKKYTTNRLTQTGNVYSIKEDDAVTEFESGSTTETERAPD